MPHRQAYFPRLWLSAALCGALVLVVQVLVPAPLYVAGPAAFVLGSAVAIGHLALWRRRHPVLTREELREVVRRSAPNN
jgi:hypothetical protein